MNPENMNLENMTTEEVAAYLRIPAETLRYYRWKGDKGPRSFRIGKRVLYAREDVERFLADAKGQSTREPA